MSDQAALPTELPAIQKLPRDRRGYPIFKTVFVPEDGRDPDFRVLDPRSVQLCMAERLCAICGEPLDYWICFTGGVNARQDRMFPEPAMHQSCAEFAVRVCPFLSRTKARYSVRPLPTDIVEIAALRDEPQQRPDLMFMFITRRYELVERRGTLYAKAAPFRQIIPF